VETCYRILDLCTWAFALLGAVAVLSLWHVTRGGVTAFAVFWVAFAVVLLQLLVAILRGLPFLTRYGVYCVSAIVFLLCTTAVMGVTPNWSFMVILLLASTSLFFGIRVGLLVSGLVCVIHVVVAWGWITGRLPPRSIMAGTPSAYSDFHLASVWVRVLVMSAGLLVVLQLIIHSVLGDMNRALEETRLALRQLRAEQDLRAGIERKFTAIFNQSPDMCVITRARDGRILDVNEAFQSLSGWSREESLGRTSLDLGFWADASARERALSTVIEKGELAGHEFEWRDRSGKLRVGLISMRAMEVDGERVLNVVVRDVTEARREQDRSRALEAQLSQVQKMESIGVLAGGIAHDFNNILTGILGFVEIARLTPGCEGEIDDYLAEIAKAGMRAKDLVAQILTFSRQRQEEHVPVDLATVVDETIRFLRISTSATIEIDTRLAAGHVRGEPTRIHQVVLNLVNNAIQSMRDRPGKITVTIDRAVVDEALASSMPNIVPGTFMLLTISDMGHGIDAATLGRVFEPFFTTKPIGEGTGIGLAVVRGIIHAHHGGIAVDSAVGKGTDFRVYLPRCEVAGPRAPALQPVKPGEGERVLLVDDEASISQFVGVRLKQMNYHVSLFNDPYAALAALQADPQAYDAIISDLAMPGISGVDLVHKARGIREGFPSVIVTGNSTTLSAPLLASLQGVAVVDKPFTGDDLVRALQSVLRKA
jgi:PAS domain S-box-containing protein